MAQVPRRDSRRVRPSLEGLEDRQLLAANAFSNLLNVPVQFHLLGNGHLQKVVPGHSPVDLGPVQGLFQGRDATGHFVAFEESHDHLFEFTPNHGFVGIAPAEQVAQDGSGDVLFKEGANLWRATGVPTGTAAGWRLIDSGLQGLYQAQDSAGRPTAYILQGGSLFQYAAGHFHAVGGVTGVLQAVVAGQGQLFALDGGGHVYHVVGTTAQRIGSGATRLAADSAHELLILVTDGGVWKWAGSAWTQLGQGGHVTPDGSVWYLGKPTVDGLGDHGVYRLSFPTGAGSTGGVIARVGTASRILGTLPGGSVWVANGNNEVSEWVGSGWKDLGQGAVAPDGSFWFLGGPPGSASPVYRSSGGQMVRQDGAWTDLLGVSADGKVWVANGASFASGITSVIDTAWTNIQDAVTKAVLAQIQQQGAGLGAQVVAYARQFLGRTCPPGSAGECTDLAIAALRHAGAKTTDDFGVSGPDANYVWGTRVLDYYKWSSGGIGGGGGDASLSLPIRPGDIIQYRNVTIVNPDGSGETADHHTAIIEAVLGGGAYRILEQNWDGGNPDGRVVREATINLANMTNGEYWIYQPVAK